MKTIISLFVVLVLSLSLAATAFGQSSVDGYNNQAGQVQSDVEGDTVQPVAVTDSGDDNGGGGSLPFTGLDVALLVGAGGLLVVAGLGMRRLTRAPGSA